MYTLGAGHTRSAERMVGRLVCEALVRALVREALVRGFARGPVRGLVREALARGLVHEHKPIIYTKLFDATFNCLHAMFYHRFNIGPNV